MMTDQNVLGTFAHNGSSLMQYVLDNSFNPVNSFYSLNSHPDFACAINDRQKFWMASKSTLMGPMPIMKFLSSTGSLYQHQGLYDQYLEKTLALVSGKKALKNAFKILWLSSSFAGCKIPKLDSNAPLSVPMMTSLSNQQNEFWLESMAKANKATPQTMHNIILHYANKQDILERPTMQTPQKIPQVYVNYGRYGEGKVTDMEHFQMELMPSGKNFYLCCPKMLLCEAPVFSATPDSVVIRRTPASEWLLTEWMPRILNRDYNNIAFSKDVMANPLLEIVGSMECKTTKINPKQVVSGEKREQIIRKAYEIAESDQPIGSDFKHVLKILYKHKSDSMMTQNTRRPKHDSVVSKYNLLEDCRLDISVHVYGERRPDGEIPVNCYKYQNVSRSPQKCGWLNFGSGNAVGGQSLAGLLCMISTLKRCREKHYRLPKTMSLVFCLVLLDRFDEDDDPNGDPDRVVMIIESEYSFQSSVLENILQSIKEKTYLQGQLICKANGLEPQGTEPECRLDAEPGKLPKIKKREKRKATATESVKSSGPPKRVSHAHQPQGPRSPSTSSFRQRRQRKQEQRKFALDPQAIKLALLDHQRGASCSKQ